MDGGLSEQKYNLQSAKEQNCWFYTTPKRNYTLRKKYMRDGTWFSYQQTRFI